MATQGDELKSNKDKIRKIMEENPHLRHDDRRLCVAVWKNEIGKNEFLGFELLYGSGMVTEAGVITRLSRMIRKEMGWIKQKKEEEEKVKKIVLEYKSELF